MYFVYIFLFLIGLSIGSFSNVLIYRVPRNISIVYPSSFCTNCERKIKWIHKLPLISWIVLKGKCIYCNSSISLKYPLIEILFSIVFLLNFYFYGLENVVNEPVKFIGLFTFTFLMFNISFIDIEHLKIPNKIVFTGIALSFIFSVTISIAQSDLSYFFYRLLATFIGYLGLEILVLIFFLITNKYAFGGGDSKLFAYVGSWLGLNGLVNTFLLSIYLCGIFCIFGLLSKKLKKSDKLPFGPFIALSSYVISLLALNSQNIFLIF